MKARELRERLKGIPDDMEVVVQVNDEGGCEDIEFVEQTAIGDSGAGTAGAEYVRIETLPHRSAVVIIPVT